MKKIYIIGLIFAMIFAGCADLDDINTDPNNPKDIDPDLMLLDIQFSPAAEWQEMVRYFVYPGGFMNQWTGYNAIVQYGGLGIKHSNYHERMWTTYYPGVIKSATDIVRKYKDDPAKVNTVSMARVLRVQNFLKLTDYYGDVPYSEAGLGYYDGILKPKYDTQESIYKDFLKELKEAAASFDTSRPVAKSDFYYKGDLSKWKKFANSLRLRIAIRLVKVDPALAKDEAEDAIRSGVFTSNDDICYVKYEDVQNPNSGKYVGNGVSNFLYKTSIWLSTEFVSTLENNNDPRLLLYCASYLNNAARTDITEQVRAKRSCYAAMTVQAQKYSYAPNTEYPDDNQALKLLIDGKEQNVALAYTRLRPAKYITAFDAPYIYLSYAEVEFLIAEAAHRKWDVQGGAESHYKAGIEAALKQWTLFNASISNSDIENYLNEPNIVFDENNALNQINTQLWILHLLDPLETWSNWRRSGYPELIFHNYEPARNQSNGTFPRRMQYPLEEQIKNADNYNEASSRIGEDDWTKRVWWDKE